LPMIFVGKEDRLKRDCTPGRERDEVIKRKKNGRTAKNIPTKEGEHFKNRGKLVKRFPERRKRPGEEFGNLHPLVHKRDNPTEKITNNWRCEGGRGGNQSSREEEKPLEEKKKGNFRERREVSQVQRKSRKVSCAPGGERILLTRSKGRGYSELGRGGGRAASCSWQKKKL